MKGAVRLEQRWIGPRVSGVASQGPGVIGVETSDAVKRGGSTKNNILRRLGYPRDTISINRTLSVRYFTFENCISGSLSCICPLHLTCAFFMQQGYCKRATPFYCYHLWNGPLFTSPDCKMG